MDAWQLYFPESDPAQRAADPRLQIVQLLATFYVDNPHFLNLVR
jgi:hypothetical protein